TAIQVDVTIPLGIGGWQASPARIYQDLYKCPNVYTSETFVYINTGAMASFRAPGHVEGAFGLERAMDTLARELGMDPLALRQKNYADQDQEKRRAYSAKHLDECYRAGSERFGWRPAPSAQRLASTVRGRGMSSITWGGGGGP